MEYGTGKKDQSNREIQIINTTKDIKILPSF